MRIRKQSTVTEALNNAVGKLESASRVRESLAFAYWEQVVGPQAAAATQPDTVRDGILFVKTKSSVWSQELTFMKAHIITELNRRIGKPVIKEIVFRAQGVKGIQPAEELPAPDAPTTDQLALVQLSHEEQAALDEEIKSLESISNEKIRISVIAHVIRDKKIRRWRLDNGWRLCGRCTTLHDTDGDLCPICRLER